MLLLKDCSYVDDDLQMREVFVKTISNEVLEKNSSGKEEVHAHLNWISQEHPTTRQLLRKY